MEGQVLQPTHSLSALRLLSQVPPTRTMNLYLISSNMEVQVMMHMLAVLAGYHVLLFLLKRGSEKYFLCDLI